MNILGNNVNFCVYKCNANSFGHISLSPTNKIYKTCGLIEHSTKPFNITNKAFQSMECVLLLEAGNAIGSFLILS